MTPVVSRRPTSARPSRCGTCGRCARCRRWTEPEDALVDSLVGTHDTEEIAATLSGRFGIARTPGAVSERLKRRRRSRWMEGLSLRELERIFGVDHRTILQAWVGPGLLHGRRWSGRGPPPWLAVPVGRCGGLRPRACRFTGREQDAERSPSHELRTTRMADAGLAIGAGPGGLCWAAG